MLQEIDYPANLSVLIIGIFLCLTLSLFLFFNKSAKNNANIFLGGLILVIFPFFLQGCLYRFHLLDRIPYFIGMGSPGIFLLGPFTYFYIRACIQKGFRLKPIDGLHLLPFLINFLSHVPSFLKDKEERILQYIDFITKGNALDESDWSLVIKSLHGVAYFIISIQFILQYRKHLSNETSAIDTTFHRWMLLFIILLAFPVSSIFFYINAEYQRIFILLQLSSFFLLLLAIYIAALTKPELFRIFPHQMLIPESAEVKKQRYENSKLQDAQKDKYIKKLEAHVVAQKPFLEAELTLAQLSEQVNIPAHYLSQIINEKLDCNFLDFINGYRIAEAKTKLIDPKLSHYTILSIAYEAGFNAKSTFYSVFKKHAGMTPSQYRKQMKNPVTS